MGLLDKFNRGLNAVQTGLLGGATNYNPELNKYLSPGTIQSANNDARMQLGLAMLAASESGMGFGQGMLFAQDAARQAFQNPIQDNVRSAMIVDALRKIQVQREQQDKLMAQLAAFREANPQYADEPDQILLQRMNPELAIQEGRLGLDQQQTAASIQNMADDNALQRERFDHDRYIDAQMLGLRRAQMAADGASRKPATEAQGKAGLFASRMKQVSEDLRNEAPGFKDYSAYAASMELPSGGLRALANKAISDEWLPHFNSTRAFLAGILRQDTGAAITAEEYRQYYPMFFPMPGDTPEAIEQKRALRENEMARVTELSYGEVPEGTTPKMPSLQDSVEEEIRRRRERWGNTDATGSW